jgi:diaminohydroxyphosphoribosylaminopyrimidine deaminase/5-amino-6-(5-phosphoribosylamino)uracil reductase
MISPLDEQRLDEALALAAGSIGLTEPNPRVGCVLGGEDGTVLGRGATQQAGGPHAEVMALRDAAAAGNETRGATAWVCLEPCSHHGRTPPCCDALVAAGVARVVVAAVDPNPLVKGRGLERLRAAGIVVEVAAGRIADEARELNIGFFSRMQRGRPWVRLKIAQSLDGRTALPDGRSAWITGEPARADGHAWRQRAGAVLTGIGTVLADDPRLDVRLVPTPRQPLRVVLDSQLRTPPRARVLAPPGGVLVVAAMASSSERRRALEGAGAELMVLDGGGPRPDLAATLDELARRGVNELHVEAGATLNGAWLDAGLVDELLVYQAGCLLGAGRPAFEMRPPADLGAASRWRFVEVSSVGDDLRLRLRPALTAQDTL